MRKTPFKKKPTTPLKRSNFKKKTGVVLGVKKSPNSSKTGNFGRIKTNSKLKQPKLPSRKSLEKKLWELCKQIIRKRHGNICYTTGQTGLTGGNWQTGHGKPKGALSLKYQYDLRNLRPQSYHANINLGGMTDIFIAKLEREKEGLEFLQEACVKIDGKWEIKRVPLMGSTEAKLFLMQKIEEYKALL